jgi:hypothetical protein
LGVLIIAGHPDHVWNPRYEGFQYILGLFCRKFENGFLLSIFSRFEGIACQVSRIVLKGLLRA